MIIESITLTECVLPMLDGTVTDPEFGKLNIVGVPRWIVEITGENGQTGVGESHAGLGRGAVETAARRLVGRDLTRLSLAYPQLVDCSTGGPAYFGLPVAPSPYAARRMEPHLRGRLSSPAALAVETGLLDLIGRTLGVPACMLLGGAVREAVPADYWMGRMLPANAGRLAKRGDNLGFGGVKIKSALGDPDVERLESIAEACGTDFPVTIDPNCRFFRPDEALPLLRRLDAVGNLSVLEDPYPRECLSWHRDLRGRFGFSVALTPAPLFAMLQAEAADIYNVGGPSFEFMRQAAAVDLAGLRCWHGSGLEVGIGTAAMVHACACVPNCTIPSDLAGPWLYEDDLIVGSLRVENGCIVVPTGPGLGVTLDRAALDRYTTSRVVVTRAQALD